MEDKEKSAVPETRTLSYGIFFGEISIVPLQEMTGEGDFLDEYLEAYGAVKN